MNRNKLSSQASIFFQVNTKEREIRKWLNDVNRFSIKSIYNLTWSSFYKKLHQLGIKEFLKQYGYVSKKQLQLVIAKSTLSQNRITLYDFEKSTERELYILLGNSFFDKVTPQADFNAKNHLLSTIHYYMYHHSLNFTAISLGFSSKQYFLNFFAQTLYVLPEGVENRAQNLRVTILSLYEVDPATMRKKLAALYDKPLAQSKNFIKYDYTLEELKLALENENTVLVVASLGGSNAYHVNKKLQTLRPWVNVSLQALKLKSWESLKGNTPIFIWKIKLYQLFSGKIPLDQWMTSLYRPVFYMSDINFHCQFFTSIPTQSHTEDRDTPLNLRNSHSLLPSFYAT